MIGFLICVIWIDRRLHTPIAKGRDLKRIIYEFVCACVCVCLVNYFVYLTCWFYLLMIVFGEQRCNTLRTWCWSMCTGCCGRKWTQICLPWRWAATYPGIWNWLKLGFRFYFYFSFFEVGKWNEFEFALIRDRSFTMELLK